MRHGNVCKGMCAFVRVRRHVHILVHVRGAGASAPERACVDVGSAGDLRANVTAVFY